MLLLLDMYFSRLGLQIWDLLSRGCCFQGTSTISLFGKCCFQVSNFAIMPGLMSPVCSLVLILTSLYIGLNLDIRSYICESNLLNTNGLFVPGNTCFFVRYKLKQVLLFVSRLIICCIIIKNDFPRCITRHILNAVIWSYNNLHWHQKKQ